MLYPLYQKRKLERGAGMQYLADEPILFCCINGMDEINFVLENKARNVPERQKTSLAYLPREQNIINCFLMSAHI